MMNGTLMNGIGFFKLLRILRAKKLDTRIWDVAQARAIRTPYSAFYFAKVCMGTPWPEAEPIIAKTFTTSYYYMMQMLGRHIGMDPGMDEKIVNRWRRQQGWNGKDY
jgi:hypothetical protein